MSTSPWRYRLKPPPVPWLPTSTLTSLDLLAGVLGRLADPEDGAGAVHDDGAGHLCAPARSARGGGLIRSPTARERQARQQKTMIRETHRFNCIGIASSLQAGAEYRAVLEPFQVVADREIRVATRRQHSSSLRSSSIDCPRPLENLAVDGEQRTWPDLRKVFRERGLSETLKHCSERP